MKFFSVILALCFAIALNATNDPTNLQATVKPVETKKLEVKLINLQQQRTDIMIQSLDGDVTYYHDVVKKHNGYRKRLNLSDLKAGKYMLVIENADGKLKQVVVVRDNAALLLSNLK